jgi:hypothetical protein
MLHTVTTLQLLLMYCLFFWIKILVFVTWSPNIHAPGNYAVAMRCGGDLEWLEKGSVLPHSVPLDHLGPAP